MRNDLPDSDVADHLLDDLLVERLAGNDSAGFSRDLEKRSGVDELPKSASTRVFLQAR
jgi:hypothetical protein